ATAGPFDAGRMAARPPALGRAARANDRIVRAILPWAIDRSRSRCDDHVAGRRPAGPADCTDEIEPAAAAEELRTFERIGFRYPAVGIVPAVISLLDRSGGC